MHGAQRWLERDRDALVPMTPTTSASATWPAPPPIGGRSPLLPASRRSIRTLGSATLRSACLRPDRAGVKRVSCGLSPESIATAGIPASFILELSQLPLARQHPERIVNPRLQRLLHRQVLTQLFQ